MVQLSGIARVGWIIRPLIYTWQGVLDWWRSNGMWWAVSVTAHALVLSTVLLLLGQAAQPAVEITSPTFTMDTTIAPPLETPIDMSPPLDTNVDIQLSLPTPLDTTPQDMPIQSADINESGLLSVDATIGGDSTALPEGLASITELRKTNDAAGTRSFAPSERTTGTSHAGGPGESFGDRRGRMGRGGGGGPGGPVGGGRTKGGDRAVANALAWIARHQDPDGRWSLSNFARQCRDGSCACKAGTSDTAATALALLPLLATGETHRSKGKYRQHMSRGLYWLTSQQKSDGDLRSGSGTMYSHGLATIALCEAYGLSGDEQLGAVASRAINFILSAQDPVGGGWRYEPKQSGDLSVVGWQLMALKSGRMAGLPVPSEAFELAAKFVKTVGDGKGGFGYTDPGRSNAMSAVGLLCTQYLGAERDDQTLRDGSQILLANLPNNDSRNTYYWYYATQVMHNLHGSEWDTWNRRMRKVLIESQETQGCAAGSWNPAGHPFADQGGRLMVTALNTLSLEVYYRYLPLYKIGR